MRTLTILALLFITTEQERLPRSVYVPVRFETCEHVKDATINLIDGDTFKETQHIGTLPREQTFMFTNFPDLGTNRSPVYHLKFKGTFNRQPIEKIITIGSQKILIHHLYEGKRPTVILLNEHQVIEKKFRVKIDAHYAMRTIKITCSDSCDTRHQKDVVKAGTKQNP